MSQTLTVTLRILDKEYQVACPPEERYNLEEAARHLDTTMRDIRNRGKVVGVERIAVMAALNISHAMLTGDSQKTRLVSDQQQEISELNSRLDQALQRHQS